MAQVLVLARPLSTFMDRASLMETIRFRLRHRRSGLALEQSHCQQSADEFAEMNLQMVSGEAGWDAICEFMRLLVTVETEELHRVLNISMEDSMKLIIPAMCDSWRRLVLPYQGLPFQVLKIIRMDPNTGLSFMKTLREQACGCSFCEDRFFSQVSRLEELLGPDSGRSFFTVDIAFEHTSLDAFKEFIHPPPAPYRCRYPKFLFSLLAQK